MLVSNRLQPIRFKGLFSPKQSSSDNEVQQGFLGETGYVRLTDDSLQQSRNAFEDSFTTSSSTAGAIHLPTYAESLKSKTKALKRQDKASANALSHLNKVKKTIEKKKIEVLQSLYLMALRHNYLTIQQQYLQNGRKSVYFSRPACKIEHPPSQIEGMDLDQNMGLFERKFIKDCQKIQREMLDKYDVDGNDCYRPNAHPSPSEKVSTVGQRRLGEIFLERQKLETDMEQLKQDKLKKVEDELNLLEEQSRMISGEPPLAPETTPESARQDFILDFSKFVER